MMSKKFRIWDIALEDFAPPECVLGFLVNIANNELTLKNDQYVIEQYTGLKDYSSFKEVCQGDKVNIIIDGKEIKDLIVEWSDEKCGFVFVNEDWNISFFRIEHIEITGNIHEETK